MTVNDINHNMITAKAAALNECLEHLQEINKLLMILNLASEHRFYLPIDQVSFDHGALLASIRTTLDGVCKKIPTQPNIMANTARGKHHE
ncbi:hypothetical protein [Teredinibacter sp. KSP-S5-2]|uniref:hypothetical protein n=1 Tax=Teredinibacter sp. KSP-S5-2 TaxID=3034506 RepID=UPI002934FAFC|nr:hypothetical protein [Teredinibacter sp. KSP-S5-2]WNO10532.1 hypothetical protein P5V12_05035 [Teredinibacter sp. KSP-S5-2]